MRTRVSSVGFSAAVFSNVTTVLGHSAGADNLEYHNVFVLVSSANNGMFFFKPSPCNEAHRPQCSTCIHVSLCVYVNVRV